MNVNVILMTEEYWRNSLFSVARFCGGCKINGEEYSIVNKDGTTLLELSREKEDGMAIEPGEPADLIMNKAIPAYKKLGRERFIELLKADNGLEEINKEAGINKTKSIKTKKQ